ncbi:MAG TPA: sigma-70 family RNA polymerase sigma factor [Tepidisphaeraceae bacterium]|nr:sigma-70 family RNA polymerase sigma factor [Tepidisphaeraceae bacterium]
MDQELVNRFRQKVLTHLDEAYNLARWLTRDRHDAEDIVQEACLRALRGFGNFRGDDARAWLLTIVRNTCYTWLKRQRTRDTAVDVDTDVDTVESASADPFSVLSRNLQSEQLRAAVEDLPVEFREVIVLKDLQGMSYREIAKIVAVPIGTVMSRLARGRRRLAERLCAEKGAT